MPVTNNGHNFQSPHYSNLNSTFTALGGGEVFTGEWEDVTQFNDIMVHVVTDVIGSYQVQFSPDAENVDNVIDHYFRPDVTPNRPHRYTISHRWVRIVYTNDSAAQTYLRMSTSFGARQLLTTSQDAQMPQDYGSLPTRPNSLKYDIALGKRGGYRVFNKFGYNDDVDTTAPETIWAPGGRYTVQTTGTTLTISSDSANDDDGDTGANTILITGVDENRKWQQETVTMDGLTPVVTTTQWLGINRVSLSLCGTNQANVGNITVAATTGGATMAYVPAGGSVTQQCIYHVQLQSRGLLEWAWLNVRKLSGGTAPRCTIKGIAYNPTSNAFVEVFRHNIDTAIENTIEISPAYPFSLAAGSVLYLEAETNTNNTTIAARFSIVEVEDYDYDPDS